MNTALPSVSGPTVSSPGLNLVTASPGSWTGSGPIRFTYQWQLCPDVGVCFRDIHGATGPTYAAYGAVARYTVGVVVTATDANGSTTVSSSEFARYSVAPPLTNTVPPRISGSPVVGQPLSGSLGSWVGVDEPTIGLLWTVSAEWQRCDRAGSNCADIPGALSSAPQNQFGPDATYTVTSADVGSTLRVYVTFRYDQGFGDSFTADSAPTAVVTAAPIG